MLKKINKYQKKWTISLILSVFLMIVFSITTLQYAGKELAGNYDWIVLTSELFGIPNEIENSLNMVPLYIDSNDTGWDGQFYYYMSNDLLGLKDTVQHIDAPAYRYQRIGVPLLAKIISVLIGRDMVSVPIFIFTNILLVGIGVFVLFEYLKENKKSRLWAIPWITSGGLLIAVRHGLPDGAADALVVIAIIMILKKKYPLYGGFMTLGCLAREGYVLIAFSIFMIEIYKELSTIKFKIKYIKWKKVICIIIPGIIFIIWYLYVYFHFGIWPFEQAQNITGFYLLSWLEYVLKSIQQVNVIEFISLVIYFLIILLSLFYSIVCGKKNKIYWAFIPYIILVSSFGSTVMMHWSGYLKGISILLALISIMIIEREDKYIKIISNSTDEISNFKINNIGTGILVFVLFLSMINGIYNYIGFGKYPMVARYAKSSRTIEDGAKILENFSSDLTVVSHEKNKFVSNSLLEFFTSNYEIYEISVKNTSDEVWSMFSDINGYGAINLSYQWFRENDFTNVYLDGNRSALYKDLNPNEECNIELYVKYPEEPGNYTLRISLVQEGVTWFYAKPEASYIDISYKIK